MSLGTANRDGGKTSESGHLRALTKAFRGEVSNGLAVSQRGAGANMSVDIAVGDAIIPRSDGTYSHPAFNDAVLNQVIATADPSNPRRDILVMYIDYGNAVSTAVSNNTNGVVKVKVVAGTPAGSPVDPTDAAIQTSVGSGNPFIKLARIRVGAGVGSVSNSVIDDLRRMAESHVQGGWLYEYLYTWVYVAANQFKIAGIDVTALFPVGTKVMVNQAGVTLYFYVTAATFSTDTTVTLDGGGVYSLTNIPIDRPAISYSTRPQGFPYATISEPLNWWQELGRTKLTVANTILTVNLATTKKYLRILQFTSGTGTTSEILIFNGSQAANYDFLRNIDGDTSDNAANQTGFNMYGDANADSWGVYEATNIANHYKSVQGRRQVNYPTVGVYPKFVDMVGSWRNNTNPISSVSYLTAGAGSTFAIGSELIVLGHD